MNKLTTLFAATALLGMSASSQAANISSELMADVTNLLVSSIQESIQQMGVEAKSNLQSALKKQLDETSVKTTTVEQPKTANKEEK